MQKYQDVVLDSQGRPVAGAVIAVLEYPGGSPATVYQTDSVGAAYTPTTDDYGAFYFYAPNGYYSYTVTVNGVLRKTVTDISIYDPAADEGTWTPTDESGGTAILSIASGEYIKQGPMVFIAGRFRFVSNSDATAAVLGGLPYPAKAGLMAYHIGCASQGNTFGTTVSGTSLGALVFAVGPGSSLLYPRWADIPGLICSNSQLDITTIQFSGWYRADN